MNGIAADADQEARKLVQEAEATAQRRKTSTDAQVADILATAQKKGSDQADAILKQARSAGSMEARRIALRVREQVMERVVVGVRETLAAMREDPGYRNVLLGWIVDGAIGLNVPRVRINGSLHERRLIDEALLKDAGQHVKALTGRAVTFELDDGDPLLAQGIRLSDPDGRVAFSNDVSTRLLRYQSDIRKIVYGALFET
jgi:vacuolar-type H+-ATPase subunit E/Vma4